MRRHQHAEDQRPEVRLQAHRFKGVRPGNKRHKQSQKNYQFTVAHATQHELENLPGDGQERDDQQGPNRGQLAGRDGQVNDGHDILNDENPDGGAPVQRIHPPAFVEDFNGKYRAGETECKGQQQRRAQINFQKKPQPGEAQTKYGKTEYCHGQTNVQDTHGPHLWFDKVFDFQLQPDGEQEQRYANFCASLKQRGGSKAKGTEPQAGQQKTHQRRETQPVHQVPHGKCYCEDCRIH